MSQFSTLNYLFSSYQSGKKEVESLNLSALSNENEEQSEPSVSCINAILSFASQYDVLKSEKTGNIELNLN